MVPACIWRLGGGGLSEGEWCLPTLLCGGKLLLQPDARQFCSSPPAPGRFPSAAPVLQLRMSEFNSNQQPESDHRPCKRYPASPEALCLTQPQSWPAFTALSYRDFSSWHWKPGVEALVWGWDCFLLRETSAVEISLLVFNYHTWVWGQPFHVSAPFTILDVASSVYS